MSLVSAAAVQPTALVCLLYLDLLPLSGARDLYSGGQ